MADIQHLIRLNIEIEGLLKILAERSSTEARGYVAEKFEEYTRLMQEYLAEQHAAVKDQEAEEAEVVDEDDAAAAAITKGAEASMPPQIDVEASMPPHVESILKAFTLNDKFYFIREVFDGNEDDFNETLKVLDSIDNYTEAEEYIYDDMMLDRNNAGVKQFMAVVKRAYSA